MLISIRRSNIQSMVTALATVAVLLLLLSACSGRKKPMGQAITERDSLPVMETYDVNTLISDSGITRYRVISKEWLMYDRKEPSYWAFEKGIYFEKFDSVFAVEASIEADTAYYFDKKKIWELIGNVHIRNTKGEKFDTQHLFWDEAKEKVYSDQRVRIEQPDQIIYAWGFESNQQMTKYTFYKTDGIFYVDEEEEEPMPGDSLTGELPAAGEEPPVPLDETPAEDVPADDEP